ncbi:MAG: hypothetical protein QXT77_02415 [Candidatus Methanomethylicaceae archaeon]
MVEWKPNAKVVPYKKLTEIFELLDDMEACDQCEMCQYNIQQIRAILNQADDTSDETLLDDEGGERP